MIVYVDSMYHCHTTNPDGTLREVEESFFNGKCKTLIEGYCYDDSRGHASIYPWKPLNELAAAQRQYELDQAVLQAAYEEGVNSV